MMGFKGQIVDFFQTNNWKLKKESGLKMIFERLDDDRIIEVSLKSKK